MLFRLLAWLFINREKVAAKLKTRFEAEDIVVHSYNYIGKFLLSLPKEEKILVNPDTLSACLYDLLSSSQIKEGKTISSQLKAIKNHSAN